MTSKQLNVRFALYLVASVTVLGVGTYFVHGYQVRRNASSLLDRAHRAQADGDKAKAAELLSRYLGLEPSDTDVLADLARLLADDESATSPRSRARALLTLGNVLYREPQRHDLRRRAVQIAMSLGDYMGARADLETYLMPAFAGDAELERWLGTCYELTGKYAQARRSYSSAIQHAPHDTEACVRFAALLRRHGPDVSRADETSADVLQLADRTIDKMVEASSGSYQALLLRASYRQTFHSGQDPKMVAEAVAGDVARAQKLAPDALDCILAAANVALEQGALEQARGLLQHGRDLHPKEWQLYQAQAGLEVRERKTDAAIDCLRQGLQNQPDQLDLLWHLADLLTASGRTDEAEATIDRLAKVGVSAARLDYLNARLLVHAERWREAIRKLETAYAGLVTRANQVKDEPAAQLAERAGLLLGHCYEQIGDATQAYAAYSRVIAVNGQSVPGRRGLAGARAAQGRLPEALDQYRQLMRLPGAPTDGWVEIARLVLLTNLNRDGAQPQWDQVEEALARAEQLSPASSAVDLDLLRAESLVGQQKIDQARTGLLTKYADPTSRPAVVWTALAALEARQGHADAELGLLDQARQQCGDKVQFRLALARHWARTGGAEARSHLLSLADELDRFTTADRRLLLRGLADASRQAGLTAEATELWQRVARELPDDLRSRIAVFDVAAQAGDDVAMKRSLQEIRGIEGEDGVLWRYARIAMLIGQAQRGDKSGLSEARVLLAAIAPRRPDWSRIPLSMARIADLDQQFDVALPQYLTAIQMGERDPFALGRAIVLLSRSRRDAEANQIARLTRDQTLLSHETQWVAAEVALRNRDTERALELAQGAAGADSKDYHDHLMLGRVYWATEHPDRAGPALVRARELAPTVGETWEALVQFLVATGKTDQARAEVEAAKRQLTGKSGMLALARCHECVGQTDQARALYEETLKSAGDDAEVLGAVAVFQLRTGRLKEAQDLLRRLSGNPDRPSAAWAGRLWALVSAAEGDPAKVTDALARLDSLDREFATSADADEKLKSQRTRAQLLAVQKFVRSRREAVQILEGMIERRTATAEDQFLAAQLHESVGDWPKARARYLGLLSLPAGDTPAMLAAAARSLLRHGEADAGEQALRRLEVQAPQTVVVKELRARLLHLQNQTGKAVALLGECARADGTDPRAVAGVLEELGQFREAEELYRSSTARARRPEDALTLVHYLVRRRRFAEALDLCDQAWASCPPAAVAEACLEALAAMPRGSVQLERVAGRIEAALAQAPDQATLLVALANLRNFQSRFTDAEDLFRRAVAHDPRQTTALNNLAWLLALRSGHGDEALDLVNRAIDLVGADASMLDTRAVAYLTSGQPGAAKSAIEDLQKVLDEAPSATTFFHLAQAHELAGRHKDALKAWDDAKRRGLSAETLHPLERATYQRLMAELNERPATAK